MTEPWAPTQKYLSKCANDEISHVGATGKSNTCGVLLTLRLVGPLENLSSLREVVVLTSAANVTCLAADALVCQDGLKTGKFIT